jgi:hypothetical protein
MKKARDLVGLFTRSSQAKERLLEIQPVPKSTKDPQKVTVIQDVVTRWWSTYAMCERLLRLRPYFNAMALEGTNMKPEENLTDEQWKVVGDVSALLKPFMISQKFFEGEKYVTVSFIPFLITKMREGLKKLAGELNPTVTLRDLAANLLVNFNTHWGSGEMGTIFSEHVNEGPRRRPKGVPKLALLAAFLDIRTKALEGVHVMEANDTQDVMSIQNAIRELLRRDIEENIQENNYPVHHAPINIFGGDDGDVKGDGSDDDEPSVYYDDDNGNVISRITEGMKLVDAELLAYSKVTQQTSVRVDPITRKSVHTNPLVWWKLNETRFPHLARLARKILCIPATSASSERVFSTAGLTITQARASLKPENASSLIFLHDTIPIMDDLVHQGKFTEN